ncbi:MAG: GNAT family N-acetyltransferase [Thioalkalispiraceae bacterium]|jgi:ribosomal protein S18 acetylase RimI-like enzyme
MGKQQQTNAWEYIVMLPQHQQAVVSVITAAMNSDEAEWAKQTFDFHFSCLAQGINSAREFYLAKFNEEIAGITGLHRYRWGPVENVWLSWFAVSPSYQKQGAGKWLLSKMLEKASRDGYRKLFIETYENNTFKSAVEFYRSQGFRQVGKVDGYLPDGSAMLVFMLDIPARDD